jgi:hypothetical protein
VDDACARRGGLDRGNDGGTPQRVGDERRPSPARLAEPLVEVLAVQGHDGVRTEIARSLEPGGIAAGCNDAGGAQDAGGLERDRGDGSRRGEDEHAVVRSNGRPRRHRDPARDACDPACDGDRVVDPVRDRAVELGGNVDPLGEEAVLHGPSPVPEDVDARSAATPHRFTARDVREWRVAPPVEASGCNRQVERVERDRRYLERAVALDLHDLGRPAELDDLRGAHGGILRRGSIRLHGGTRCRIVGPLV